MDPYRQSKIRHPNHSYMEGQYGTQSLVPGLTFHLCDVSQAFMKALKNSQKEKGKALSHFLLTV